MSGDYSFPLNLEGDFSLRPWLDEDLDELVRHANNPKIAGKLTNAFPYPYTRESGKGFIEMVSQFSPPRIFCISKVGKPIGAIGIHPQSDIWSKNAELGYWLAEPYWGKGIVTAAIKVITRYGFDTFPIDRIFARPFSGNIGSQKVLEKCGFVLEAKLNGTICKNGEVFDELIYALRRTED